MVTATITSYTLLCCHLISIMLAYEKIMDRGSRAIKADLQHHKRQFECVCAYLLPKGRFGTHKCLHQCEHVATGYR